MEEQETKIVLLNGPPGSGKDEGATYLIRNYNSLNSVEDPWKLLRHQEFKQKLFELTWLIFDIAEHRWWDWYTQEGKELARQELGGLSCRQALIKVSEECIKPNFGKDYFGKAAAKRVEPGYINIFSDSGFISEAEILLDSFGRDNVLLIRIFGRGSFEGDSRTYLPKEMFEHSIDIQNNQTLDIYLETLNRGIHKWLS